MNLFKRITGKIKNICRDKISFYDFGFLFLLLFFFILLPILVWFFNPDDSVLSPLELFIIGLIITIFLSLIYFLVNLLFKIPETLKKLFSALALFLFFMIVFSPTKTGMIDGFKKDASLNFSVYFDLFKYILIFILVIFIVLFKKTSSFARTALIGTALAGMIFILFACVHGFSYGMESKKLLWDTFKSDQQDLAAFEELGTEKNVIIILWDGLQGTIAEDVFRDNPNAAEIFEGFTFFPNAIGSAPLTWRILPILYSGKFQKYYASNLEIIRKIMCVDSFFLDAKKNGFKVACKGVLPSLNIGGNKSYKSFISIQDRANKYRMVSYLFFLSNCQKRVTPLMAQRVFLPLLNKLRGIVNTKTKVSMAKKNYPEILKKDIQINKFRKGTFSNKLVYIHSSITHEPYSTENGVGYSREQAKTVFASILTDVTKSILLKLKELQIYDSSLIFVMADHGARTPETSASIKIGGSFYDLSHTKISIYSGGAYNPLLMVKKPFAKGPMKILDSPAMLTDIRGVIKAYLMENDLDKEMLFNLENIHQRKIKLILTIDPKIGNKLEGHQTIEFTGSLRDVPKYL